MAVLLVSQDCKDIISAELKKFSDVNNYGLFVKEMQGVNAYFSNDKSTVKYDSNISNESDTIFGFMLGEIYDVEQIKQNLIVQGHVLKTDTDIEVILHLYEEYGIESLKMLNGKFIIMLMDTVAAECIIITDRYGFYPLYYANIGENYIFSSELSLLARCLPEREMDLQSVKDFFNFGYIIGNKTLLKNIKKAGCASIIRLTINTISAEMYWDWDKIEKKNDDSYDKAVEKLGFLWINAIKKIVNKSEKFYLPLSGGLDSRAILSAIDYLGLNDKIDYSYTFGKKGCLDYKIAHQAAKVVGIKHLFFEINPEDWWNNAKKIVQNTMGSFSITHAHGDVSSKIGFCKPYLNGFAGDLVLGGSYLNDKLINMTKEKWNKELYGYIKNDNSIGMYNKKAIKILTEDDNKIESEDINSNYQSTDYFFISRSRVRNFTLMGIYAAGEKCKTIFPFFENELIDYVYSLPDEWRNHSKIYKSMLLKYFPKFYEAIPWQKTGVPISEKVNIKDQKHKIKLHKDRNSFKVKKKETNIILFGASRLGKAAYKKLKPYYNIVYFCDNDPNKWGKEFCTLQIIPPAELIAKKDIKVIVSSAYHQEIVTQLLELGISDIMVFSNIYSFVDYDNWFRKDSIKKDVYDILLSDRCLDRGIFEKTEIEKILENHMTLKANNSIDIGLLLTFELFCRIYIDNS